MKAITIIQPWATLIALEEKKFETRGWATRYRGELAIHAGKQMDREICQQEPFRSVLSKHGYTADNLPTGAVVAVANLTECCRIERLGDWGGDIEPVKLHYPNGRVLIWAGALKNTKEFFFGDYTDGRYAWELTDVQQLQDPIPAKGMQRLWNWEYVK
ncbi:ASCH domain-containing protein [Paenibacillus woosongensis]|uniref:ASCH domain-containing protein n=1 Tax=Paenibacillus woosongensis TaxID=307580 RepID=A0A7X2Z265_9BACL|nr:ASCH domain-containing protein [Paenibacillus woosongensis]MUG45506.1 ASCH domain-containing protein [Paenibacillus woosongensis]